MLYPVRRRSLPLTRPVPAGGTFDHEGAARRLTLDDVYAAVDARLAEL